MKYSFCFTDGSLISGRRSLFLDPVPVRIFLDFIEWAVIAMAGKYLPDDVLPDFTGIDAAYIRKYSIRGILSDLDDTLAEHNAADPHPEFERWHSEMRGLGVRLCILSNNGSNRTKTFAERFGIPYIPNAYKPRKYYYRIAAGVLHVPCENCLFLGDQLFTDIRGAKKIGMRAVKVSPLGNRSNLFIKFKRKLEDFYG